MQVCSDVTGRVAKEIITTSESVVKGEFVLGAEKSEAEQTVYLPRRMEFLDEIVDRFKLFKTNLQKFDSSKKIFALAFHEFDYDARSERGGVTDHSEVGHHFFAPRTSCDKMFASRSPSEQGALKEEGLVVGCVSPISSSLFRPILLVLKSSLIRVSRGTDTKASDKLFSVYASGRPVSRGDRVKDLLKFR